MVEQSYRNREVCKELEALEEVGRSTHWEGASHKNRNDLVIPEEKNRSQERGRVFSNCEKQVVICGRKEKHQYKIETPAQPQKKKEREKKRKDKKLDRLERQQSR